MPPCRKRDDKIMARTWSKANMKRGHPSLCESQRAKCCDCGGITGNKVCEIAVSYDSCGRCLRGSSYNYDCTEMRDKEANNKEKACARLETGVIDCKREN
jgi:hypothetical protein